MKKRIKNTIEGDLLEIALALLLLIAIGVCVKSYLSYKKEIATHPTIEDLHQLQELKDYHRSQGREIILFE